jgi:hypothetical protein
MRFPFSHIPSAWFIAAMITTRLTRMADAMQNSSAFTCHLLTMPCQADK